MSQDEMPFSSHAADQAWFSMLLVNDPNTALVGSLRPSRLHPIWVALRRPFERGAPRPEPAVSDAVEQIPGLRPRPTRWLGPVLLALGVALAVGGSGRARMAAAPPTASAAVQEERIGTTQFEARPAPSPERTVSVPGTSVEASPGAPGAAAQRDAAVAVAASVAPPARDPSASAPEGRSAAAARASKASAPRATSVKKKAAARRVRRALGQGLARSR
jgi:hypothetical protein